MQSNKQRVLLLEFLLQKPGLKLPELAEDPEILNALILNVFDELIRSKVELRNQVAALEIRNKDLEAYAHMVAHDLKEPLTTMIVTSSLTSKLIKLTNEELREHLRQIGLTAHEMNSMLIACCSLLKLTRRMCWLALCIWPESLKMFKSALAMSSGNKMPKSFFPRHGRIPSATNLGSKKCGLTT